MEDSDRKLAKLHETIGELESDIKPIQKKLEQLALRLNCYSFRNAGSQLGAKLNDELKVAEQQLDQVKVQLQKELEQKQRTKEQNNREIQKLRKTLDELRWEETEIVRLGGELDELAALNLSAELSQLQSKKDQVQQEQDQLKRIMECKAKSIKTLRQNIANQHLQERDLIDNRDLKRLIRETTYLELAMSVKNMGETEVGRRNVTGS
uniref:Uncharacterized protein n=1 Tax=Anopheles culicifacies TaxID=139723 RepID=A0A182MFX6_9DIPT